MKRYWTGLVVVVVVDVDDGLCVLASRSLRDDDLFHCIARPARWWV